MSDPPSPLATREFRLYLTSRFCAGAGMTMLRAAIAWHVFSLTGSPFHLGLIGLVQFLPVVPLTLVAGAVADAYERRRVIMAAQTLALSCALVLALATVEGDATLVLLYGAVFLIAVASAFELPSRAALLPVLVAREAFPRAVTIGSTVQALAFMTGPAVGGGIIALLGVGAVYAAYVGLLLCSLAALAGLPSIRPAVEGRAITLEIVREGLRFVRGNPVVLGCMTLDMFAVIFGGATALLPVYAQDILQVGPEGYGLLTASSELGALATSLVLVARPPIRHAGRTLLLAVVCFGVATIVFGLSRAFPLSLVAYLAVGVADQVSVVLRSTLIQLATPDVLRGRVSAVNFLFIGASNQLGAAESGFVAALTNATFAVASGGVACLLVVAIVALRLPTLRHARLD